ncbi:quinone-dependent dihydroorotate dehydrogenase [Sphingosinicella sp. LHD-64]|uniref:quinone-dependent dihydroorotate dehydrogenase n=1 Tax=Sphingosinicella sp. LHD-64 TaxID=3072139 RepID=UPI00280F96B7|nr:quinone-dependent dihydroorotate dehydrogenase [Sphingosinicella sp. LHD-64]MDQ8756996.1 quinone-dependent dihydroorotate dehydrogenase [Sphingosinicella sp. LHD-64]
MALYSLVRPLAFALDGEAAHRLTIRSLKLAPAGRPAKADPVLKVNVAGLDFPNPVGLAAGFDKDAEVWRQMLGFGFGFVEVGTLTPQPQAGNDRPRLFRLAEDRAVINRMGFNNGGQAAALARLARRHRNGGIVGVNIGANKDSPDRIADYAAGVRAMLGVADYLTVNISSPNTPGLRALQDKGALDALLAAVMEARGVGPPVFLKVAPDLERQDIDDLAAVAIARKIDALIVSNTTVSRPVLRSKHREETGGLSGAPLKALALARLRDFRRATGGALPLIAAGGIETAADAYARIRAGASLVQLYSALVYEGPGLARRIASGLRALMESDGFARLTDAIGTEKP